MPREAEGARNAGDQAIAPRDSIDDAALRPVTQMRGSGPAPARAVHAHTALGIALFFGLVPLLALLPYWFDTPLDVVSAAAAEGYNSQAAFAVAALWLTAGLVTAALLPERGSAPHVEERPAPDRAARRTLALGALAVGGLVFIGYFPPFLAQRGPFIEDHIHLTALHRMIGGQRPYVDFEFLYGPLMLYPAYGWVRAFGYSLASFYTYVALLEALVFAALFVVVWRLVRPRAWRALAAVVVGALLFNALVGPNWSASRRLLGMIALLVIAHEPLRWRSIGAAAVLVGLQLAWSHDYGFATLAGAACIYGVLLLNGPRLRATYSGIAVAAGAVLTWLITAWLLLGSGFGAYMTEASQLTRRFSAGEAGFRFYWTVNSLAAFALICFSVVVVGRGLRRMRHTLPGSADLLLAGGLGFALLGLKSGLNRADLWHINAPLLPLVLALLPPQGRRTFHWTPRTGRLVATALVVLAGTYFFGLLPSASELGRGWYRGMQDVIAGGSVERPRPASAAPLLGWEQRAPAPVIEDLAHFVAQPGRAGRPALFYSDTWTLGKHIGIYKTDFVNDDFLYSDERGERVRAYVEHNPDALVFMTYDVYARLYGHTAADEFPEHERRFRPSAAKSIASWLSTVHYRGLEQEVRLKDERWRRTVGEWLRQRYSPVARFGRIFVLEATTRQ
jgi:hypothetical protein